MKRLFSALGLAFALCLTGAASQAQAATTYTFSDLSPAIPHKSGAPFTGIWNDGRDWLATNGTDSLLVDGTNFAVTNITPRLQGLGLFQPVAAAGAHGTWVVAGDKHGISGQFSNSYLTNDTLVFVELTPNGERIIPAPWDSASKLNYVRPVLFRAGQQIYMLISVDNAPKLYLFQDEQFFETPIPQWVLDRNPYLNPDTSDFQDETAVYFYDGTLHPTDAWIVFDGQWTTSAIPNVSQADLLSYSLSQGNIISSPTSWSGSVHPSYGIVNGRDALDHASRRADGVALLSGIGANGLRLVLAEPQTLASQPGTIQLTVARVPKSTSRYTLTAQATGPVSYIRILKDGIGIMKCAAQSCSVTVDVKGTMDRFEAWAASSNTEGRILTSKAVDLRDTATITSDAWKANSTAWTWAQPSSFLDEAGERVSWHVGSYIAPTVNQYVCDVLNPYQQAYPKCRFKANPAAVKRALADVGSLKTEIFAEGKLATTCSISKDTADKERAIMRAGAKADSVYGHAQIDDCAISFIQADAPTVPVTITANGYTYNTTKSLGTVRVYAKISWTEQGKKHITMTPTDVVTFKTN